jgi:hypothetical protein
MNDLDFLFADSQNKSSGKVAMEDDIGLDAIGQDICLGKRTAAAVDLKWLESEDTIDPEKEGVHNPNNVKGELEIQWNGKGIEPLYKDEEFAGEVKRNLAEDQKGIAKKDRVIKFARQAMNSGLMGRKLAAALKRSFTAEDLKFARAELEDQLSLDGIVGTIMIDARGYRNCSEALKVASNSPYKGHIKCVLGCRCGDLIHMASKSSSVASVPYTGNASDSFLSTTETHASRIACHCPSTKMRVIKAGEDLSNETMDQGIIDALSMAHRVGANESEIKKVSCCASKKLKVASAFRLLDSIEEKKVAAKYVGTVDSSQYKIASDFAFDVGSEIPDFDLDGHRGYNEEFGESQVPVDGALTIELVPVDGNAIAPIDVGDTGPVQDLEIDPQGVVDSEFEGGDVVEPAPVKKIDQIPVDMDFDEIV